jgi:hypothetical protein
MTSGLVGGEWSASRPGPFSPGERVPPVPIGYEAGWSQEAVWTTWRGEKSCPYRDSNSDPPVASRYTDCAIPLDYNIIIIIITIIIIIAECFVIISTGALSHQLHQKLQMQTVPMHHQTRDIGCSLTTNGCNVDLQMSEILNYYPRQP